MLGGPWTFKCSDPPIFGGKACPVSSGLVRWLRNTPRDCKTFPELAEKGSALAFLSSPTGLLIASLTLGLLVSLRSTWCTAVPLPPLTPLSRDQFPAVPPGGGHRGAQGAAPSYPLPPTKLGGKDELPQGICIAPSVPPPPTSSSELRKSDLILQAPVA